VRNIKSKRHTKDKTKLMLKLIKKRKAQITVFIIIGIIIVFSFGIYSYVRMQQVPEPTAEVPKSPPVIAFIEACMEQTAKEAIIEIGNQGGYLNLPPDIELDPTRHVDFIPGVGGEYAPKVPYWYFDGQNQIPDIKYVEFEVDRYVDENLRYCLQNYTGLRDEFDITEKSNYTTDTVFAEKETIINLNYKVEITPKGSGQQITKEQFIVHLPVQVKRMWEASRAILDTENNDTFFEKMTINLMASHPPEDIPFTGMDVSCIQKQWVVSDIKKKLLTALEPAITGIRFQNTDTIPYVGKPDEYLAVHNAVLNWRESEKKIPLVLPKKIPSDSYDYFQYQFQFTNNSYKDFRVLSTYKKQWGMNMLATPSQFGIMKSGTQNLKSKIMSFLCLNTFHFVYDVTYPIMISVNDQKAFEGEGYTFRYAIPVQIFHNAPDRTIQPTRLIEPEEHVNDYCQFQGAQQYTIIAKDRVTNAELSHANLTFLCISESCMLGTTRTNNQHLQWSGKFPSGCAGAVIRANKAGYLETDKQFDGSDPFYIEMYPTQTVKFDIRRHTDTNPEITRFLEPDSYAIVQIESENPPLSIFDIWGANETFNSTSTFELIRADATYNLNIMLMKKMNKEDDKLVGGWIGNWTVKLEDILDAKKVIFHAAQKYPTPVSDEDLMAAYELMTNRTKSSWMPQIIRADDNTQEEATI